MAGFSFKLLGWNLAMMGRQVLCVQLQLASRRLGVAGVGLEVKARITLLLCVLKLAVSVRE